ncbi:MAG: flavocytochrome c [Lachnospiraceae bacterium]|nr:flavocytochrome c [Lachnospiraceae bacterium]
MKKIMTLLLVGVLLVTSLTACSSKKTETTDQEVNTETTTDTNNDAEGETSGDEIASENLKADIVVIGAGGAGMTAAIQAKQDGATNVVIVEKMPLTGGNTTRATGGLNAAETIYQENKGVKDSIELFVKDTLAGGKNLNDVSLVQTLAENSAEAVDWVNSIGGDLSVVAMFGGASVERIHRPSDTSAVGPMLVKALNNQLAELEIPVLLETTAEQILVDENGTVTGVKIKNKDGEQTIECKTVILATGGFGYNFDMVVENDADLKGFNSTNHSGATGDGIAMATEINAATVDMDQIQIHPTVDPETQTLYTEGVRGNGAILVNKEGNRFVNEILTRDVVSAAILEQTDAYAWLVFDQEVRESLSAIEKYINAGLVYEADTIEELAEMIGADAETLKATMETYASYQANGTDEEFGRADMPVALTTAKFYAAKCAPAIHHTMGGLKINTNSEVINTEGNVIAGLYAAGEVTGGVHGAERLGGNAVADIVVFGRIAGSNAAAYVVANGGNTEPTITVEADAEEVTPEVQGNFTDGTYTGTGTGNGGEITVEVIVEGGNITTINVVDQHETPGIFESAESGVISSIIKTQSTTVDVVTGATNSSNGIMEAVANALK